ncbi:hypothetical protein EXIGLDRAFT_736256 [Exidia glandulosa HHB12029]|uniref:Uncharacterized protein n=1 Tax=Exidia glandulosa HHB12029 TaxID=1314781 RepID=A0A165JH50_EXIGL|nr:hypothetical protein EXIGLDRAFT_736256 [Exidia glandulosa HHB12029]
MRWFLEPILEHGSVSLSRAGRQLHRHLDASEHLRYTPRRLSLGHARIADPPNAAKQIFDWGLLVVMSLLAAARALAIGVSLASLAMIDPAVLHGDIHGAPQILQHAYNGVFLIAVFDLLFTALDLRSRIKQLEGECDAPVYLVTVLAMPVWFLHVAYSVVQAFATSHQPLPFITDVESLLLPMSIFGVLLVAGFYCAPRGMTDAEAQKHGAPF